MSVVFGVGVGVCCVGVCCLGVGVNVGVGVCCVCYGVSVGVWCVV